jgi:hypothetical protein
MISNSNSDSNSTDIINQLDNLKQIVTKKKGDVETFVTHTKDKLSLLLNKITSLNNNIKGYIAKLNSNNTLASNTTQSELERLQKDNTLLLQKITQSTNKINDILTIVNDYPDDGDLVAINEKLQNIEDVINNIAPSADIPPPLPKLPKSSQKGGYTYSNKISKRKSNKSKKYYGGKKCKHLRKKTLKKRKNNK